MYIVAISYLQADFDMQGNFQSSSIPYRMTVSVAELSTGSLNTVAEVSTG